MAGSAQFEQGLVNGFQSGLLVLGIAAVGITAYLEAGLLQQGADLHGGLVLAYVAALAQALLHPAQQFHGLVGAIAEHCAACLAALAGLFQLAQGLLVAAHGLALLLQALVVGGLLDLAEHHLHLAVQRSQGFSTSAIEASSRSR